MINSCLQLIGSRAFEYGELKKAMLQAVIIVITGNGAKYNEPVLFMRIMVRGGCLFLGWKRGGGSVCVGLRPGAARRGGVTIEQEGGGWWFWMGGWGYTH